MYYLIRARATSGQGVIKLALGPGSPLTIVSDPACPMGTLFSFRADLELILDAQDVFIYSFHFDKEVLISNRSENYIIMMVIRNPFRIF